MASALDGNRASRDAILARVRKALGRDASDARAQAEAVAYLAARPHGPRPTMPADLVAGFMQRAPEMASTVERLDSLDAIPAAVARYLDSLQLPPETTGASSRAGVCWPEFAALDWNGAGLAIEPRPTVGGDRLGISGCFCAIAETGTLVLLAAPEAPTATVLLPDTHIAIIRAERIVSGMEEAFALIRAERGELPRAVNMVSGPSRTGDIEQTIVLGAHGPFRMHVLVLGRGT